MAKQPTLVWDDAPSSTPTKPVKLIFDDEFKPASSTVPPKPPAAPAPAKRLGKARAVSWLGEANLPVVGQYAHPGGLRSDVVSYPAPTKENPGARILLATPAPGPGGGKRASDIGVPQVVEQAPDGTFRKVGSYKPAVAPEQQTAPAQSPAPERPRISDLMRNRETVEQWKSRRPKEVAELERDYEKAAKFRDNGEPDVAAIYEQSAAAKYAKLQLELGLPDQFISQQRQVEMGMLTPPQLAMQGADGRTASIQSLRGSDTQGSQASELGAGVGEQAAQYDDAAARVAAQRGYVSGNAAGRTLQSFGTGVESVAAGAARLLPGADQDLLNEVSRNQASFQQAAGERAGSGWLNAGVERAGQGIAQSYGVVAPGAALGAVTGGAATGMALTAGLSQYGQAYQQATDAGLRGADREQFATINAAAESLMSLAFTKLLKMPGLEGAFAKAGIGAETAKGVLLKAAKQVGMSGLEELPEEVLTQIAQNVNTRMSGVDAEKKILTGDELFDIAVQSFGAAGGARALGILPSVPGEISKANVIRGNAKAYVETPTGPADWAKSHPMAAEEIAAAVQDGKPISRAMMEANSLPTMDSVKRSKWAADVHAAVRNQVADAAGLGEAVAATPDAESQNPIPTEVQRSEDLRGRIDAERASQAAAVRNLGPEYEQRAQAIEAGAEDAAIAQDIERRMAEEESAPFSNSPKPKGPQFVNTTQPIETAAEGSFGNPQVGDEVVDTREVEGKAGKGTRRGRVVSVEGDWATVQPKFGKQYKVPVGRLEVRGRPGTPKAKGLQEQPVGEGEDFVTPMGGSLSRNTVAPQDQQQGADASVPQPNIPQQPAQQQPTAPAQPQAEVPQAQQAEAGNAKQDSQDGVGVRTIELTEMDMEELRRKGFTNDQIAMMDDATLRRNGVARIKYNPPPLKIGEGRIKRIGKSHASNPATSASPALTQGQQIRVISRAYPGTDIKPVAGTPGRYTVTLPNGNFITVLYTPEVVEGPVNRERLRQSIEARTGRSPTEAELDNATVRGLWRVSDGKGFEIDGQGLVRILDSLGEGQATATALHEARHSFVSMGLLTEAEFDALLMEAVRKSGQKPKTIADAEEMIAAMAERGDLGARGFIQTLRDIINRFMAAITGDRWKPNAQTVTKRIQSGKVLRRAGKTESRGEAAARLSAEVGGDVRYSAEMNNPLQVEQVDLSKFGWREQDDDYIYHVTSKPNADKIARSGFGRGKSMFTAGSYPAYSKGKTFFTDRSGVKYWEDRVEQQLFHSYDDPPDVAVVRIPKSLVADILQDDKTGTDDAKHNAYYIDTNKLTAAQKKAKEDNADIRYSAEPTQAQKERTARLANPGMSPDVRNQIDAERLQMDAPETQPLAEVQRLADAITPDQARAALASGKPVTAPEMEAARRLKESVTRNALVNRTAANLAESAKVIAQYDLIGTESARAFNIRRDRVETPFQRNQRLLGDELIGAPKSIRDAIKDALRLANEALLKGDKKTAKVERDRATKLSREGARMAEKNRAFLERIGLLPKDGDESAWNEIFGNDIKSFRLLREASALNQGYGSAIMEYWNSMLLSGPATQFRNLLGTPLNYGIEAFIERPILAAARVAIGKQSAGDTLRAAKEWWKGFSLAGAWRHAADSYMQETSTFDRLFKGDDYGGLLENMDGYYSIRGLKGRVIRGLGWGPLRAADQFWKALIGGMEVGRFAYAQARSELGANAKSEDISNRMAEIMADYHSDAWEKASARSDIATFTEKGSETRHQVKQRVKALRNVVPGAKFIIPFIDTPVNIAAQTIERAPALGALRYAFKMRDNIKNKRPTFDGLGEAAVKQLVSTAALTALLQSGLMSDDDDKYFAIRSGQHADPLKRYTFKWGDTDLSYQGLEPVASLLSLMADWNASQRSGVNPGTVVVGSTIDQIANKPMLQGLGDILQIMNPRDYGTADSKWKTMEANGLNYAKNFGASWVPAIYKQTVKALRPNALNTRIMATDAEGKDKWTLAGKRMLEQAELGWMLERAGFKDAPAAQVDIFGRPKSNVILDGDTVLSNPVTDFMYRLTSPLRTTEQNAHPANELLAAWNRTKPEGAEDYKLSAVEPRYTDDKGKAAVMDEHQFEQLQRLAGGIADKLYAKGKFDPKNPTEAQVAMLTERLLPAAKEEARKLVVDSIVTGKPVAETIDQIADRLDKKVRVSVFQAASEKVKRTLNKGEKDWQRDRRVEKSLKKRGLAQEQRDKLREGG